jgi:hypothetical protein
LLHNMKHHPLVRTSQDIRRSITRLKALVESPLPIDKDDKGAAFDIIHLLEQAHKLIPDQYRDADLSKEG